MIKSAGKQKELSISASSSYETSSYSSSSFSSSEGPDLLGNLSSLSIDLINPLLNSYSISGGTTAGDESSSYDSSYSTTTESSSESSEPVTKKTVQVTKKPVEEPAKKPAEKPVVQLPVKQKPVENAGVVKKGFVMPDHEPTDDELAELEAKLKMNVKGNRFQKMVGSPTVAKQQQPTKEPTPQPAKDTAPLSPKPQPTPPTQAKPLPNPTREPSTKELPSASTEASNKTGWSRTDSTKRERTNEGVDSTSKNNKNSAERNKGSRERNFFGARDKKVFTDVEGDTFSLFRRMNEIREEKKQGEKKEPEPKDEEPRDAPVVENDVPSDGTEQLLREYSVKEDMNKEGMKKAKKFSVTTGKGQPKFQMEDMNFCSYPHNKNKNLGLFCVFDGHAGKKCAETLTKLFPQTFYKKFVAGKWDEKSDLAPLLKEVYQEVDAQLSEYLYEGSTATTVIVWRNIKNNKRYIQSANLGDSTAFLVRNGKSMILSEDHKLTIQSERQRIINMGVALTQDQTRLCGLAVARAFGDMFPKSEKCGITADPYISPALELLKTDTTLLLASDGLWDIVPDGQKAYDLIKNIKSASDAAKLLLKTAVPPKNNVCSDNVTVCVVSLI